MPEVGGAVKVASVAQQREAVVAAYNSAIGGPGDPHERWKFATEKRRAHVDRAAPEWRGANIELADFIEAYEEFLHAQGLIDFDDMPLLALRIVREHAWVRSALTAKFPVLFVDEYQDLGNALHALVLLLCFEGGMRLFAVGDADQSMYGFQGASPELLFELSERPEVETIKLRFNYRCGTSIIAASIVALGEERDYQGIDGAPAGIVDFHSIDGNLDSQASFVMNELVPKILAEGTSLGEIGVLYRTIKQADPLASAAAAAGIPVVRADNNALVKRSLRLARFLEACASWQSGGWKKADPPFHRLAHEASALVYAHTASQAERWQIEQDLMIELQAGIDAAPSAHTWLSALRNNIIEPWKARSRNPLEDWTAIDTMISRTDPAKGEDITLASFGGRIDGGERLNLSTLHSAKGREWDCVVLFAMNADVIPHYYENTAGKKREARRQFYVGVTRPRHSLFVVFQEGNHSPFVAEIYNRTVKQN